MKRWIIRAVLISFIGLNGGALAQHQPAAAQSVDNYLSHLPADLKLQEDEPQKYRITCDYLYLDTVGNLTSIDRITGEYTRALPGDKVKWNNVRIAQAKNYDAPFPEGQSQKYMEGFTYAIVRREDMLKPEFFPGFPASEIKTKNMVWDMHMIEEFAWQYFDKLELNQPYAIQSQPEDVALAGAGTFQNHRIELTWLGLSKRNNELCALIRYQAFLNKFTVAMGNMNFQGRSHYWGEIWVSLKDKQIEHATLFEDVLVEFKLPGKGEKQLTNVLRKIAFEKQVR